MSKNHAAAVEYPPLIGLFDTHSHPLDGRFDSDREELFERMRQTQMISVCVGADMPSSAEAVELARREQIFYASVGVHPHDAKDFTDADIPVLTKWLQFRQFFGALQAGVHL